MNLWLEYIVLCGCIGLHCKEKESITQRERERERGGAVVHMMIIKTVEEKDFKYVTAAGSDSRADIGVFFVL